MTDHSIDQIAGVTGAAWPQGSTDAPGMTGLGEQPGAAYLAYPAYPADLAFLADIGVSASELNTAMARAEDLGVSAHDILISANGRTQRAYLRALARALGLPFIDPRDAAISNDAFSARALSSPLATRILPVDHHGQRYYALMPQGRDVERLFTLVAGPDAPARLAIACPNDGREAMIAQAGDRLLATHITPLLTERPDLSAHDTPRRAGRCFVLSFLAVSAMLIAVAEGYLPLFLPVAVATIALAIVFGIALGLRCAFMLKADQEAAPRLPENKLPTYSVLVPVYREARIIPQLLAALGRIDYPAPFIEFLLLLEGDDEETREAIAAVDGDRRYAVLKVPPGLPRTKPRALQLGLAFARGELVTIFDAEDIPAPDQLRCAAAAFAGGGPRLACVQAPLAIDNADASWLARQFALEYAALFRVVIPGLASLDMPVMLGGTSNHFRTSALRHVMGWDPWNVTEDADLGIRLARFGYSIGAVASQTQEEAPARFTSWFSQRRRWLKGWMQTALVHLSHPLQLTRDLSWRGSIALAGTLVATLAAALIYPLSCFGMMILLATIMPVDSPNSPLLMASAIILFVAGHGVAILMIAIGARRSGIRLRLIDVVSLPAYWVLVSLAAWIAVVDLARSPFYWAKTDHVGRQPHNS
ncbi:MAG: glycosyltransferase [Hyphomicrobiales bacterium]|nr:glycosyltransferase [Hyphomicrobiales bacterium]